MASVKTAHAATSVRARSRPDPNAPDRRTVYKPVVDNPLTVDWPPLPASVRAAILQELLQVIEGATTGGKSLADWRLDQHARRRGHPSTRPCDQPGQRASDSATVAPPLLSELVVGINEVTRALESRIRWGRWELGDSHAAPPSSSRATEGRPEPRPGAPAGDDEAGTGRGRKRKRKHPTGSSSCSRAPPPALPIGDHPAYAFVHDSRPPSSRRARPPTPTRNAPPPYLTCASGESTTTASWRVLVNSDARRMTKPAERARGPRKDKEDATLLPAHPSEQASSAEASTSTDTDTLAQAPPSASSEAAAPTPAPTVPLIDLVFVCKPDINPPSLVAHVPTMVAAANGVQSALDSVLHSPEEAAAAATTVGVKGARGMELDADAADVDAPEHATKRPEMRPVLLVPLDVGAERKLADALGLRRVAAIAVSSAIPATQALYSLLQSYKIQPLSTPWLVPYLLHPHAAPVRETSRFAPTTIKHVKTSAPLNPKAGVQQRKEDRKHKKEAVAELKRKKRKVAIAKARANGDLGASAPLSDDVYVAED
ncbi:hypothetical protein JCM3774_004588 [Rhodotorula dairenensis]